jgi:hypothetical protein
VSDIAKINAFAGLRIGRASGTARSCAPVLRFSFVTMGSGASAASIAGITPRNPDSGGAAAQSGRERVRRDSEAQDRWPPRNEAGLVANGVTGSARSC